MVLSTSNLVVATSNLVVVKTMAEDASLVVVVAVAVMAAALGDNLDSCSNMVMVATRLGNSLDNLDTLVATLMVTLVEKHLGSSLGMEEVVVVPPGGVALLLGGAALRQDRSSASDVGRQAISLPIVRRQW